MAQGKLFILSGPSGVGKGTVREKIMSDEKINLTYSISMTTRSPRVGEINGVHYFFVDEETFNQKIANDDFLEHAEFVGNKYGTPKSFVEELLNKGINVLLEIEVEGAKQVIQKRPDAITIFMVPPSLKELENRIRGRRSEPEEVIQKRLEKAKREIKLQSDYKYVVVNDYIDRVGDEIANIIKNEGNN